MLPTLCVVQWGESSACDATASGACSAALHALTGDPLGGVHAQAESDPREADATLGTVVCSGYVLEAHALERRLSEAHARLEAVMADPSGEYARTWLADRAPRGLRELARAYGSGQLYELYSESTHAKMGALNSWLASPVGDRRAMAIGPMRDAEFANPMLVEAATECRDFAVIVGTWSTEACRTSIASTPTCLLRSLAGSGNPVPIKRRRRCKRSTRTTGRSTSGRCADGISVQDVRVAVSRVRVEVPTDGARQRLRRVDNKTPNAA